MMPSKWVYDPDNQGRELRTGLGIQNAANDCVAHVPYIDGENPVDFHNRARLVAAAPEMADYLQSRYEFLCHQEAEFDGYGEGDVPQALTDEIAELRAILAKLTKKDEVPA